MNQSVIKIKILTIISYRGSSDVHVVRDPPDLPERMFQADFAVTTASTTTYELLALGTPIISIPVADNQEPGLGEVTNGGTTNDSTPELQGTLSAALAGTSCTTRASGL